jgi:hypothetical protein
MQQYDDCCQHYATHGEPLPTHKLPKLTRLERNGLKTVYAKLTGWTEADDGMSELEALLGLEVHLSLEQKRAALSKTVSVDRRQLRETKFCINVLVLECVASSGRMAIAVRVLRAVSDMCLLWGICLIIDEDMTGGTRQCDCL